MNKTTVKYLAAGLALVMIDPFLTWGMIYTGIAILAVSLTR
jgi:hypothetical protein